MQYNLLVCSVSLVLTKGRSLKMNDTRDTICHSDGARIAS